MEFLDDSNKFSVEGILDIAGASEDLADHIAQEGWGVFNLHESEGVHDEVELLEISATSCDEPYNTDHILSLTRLAEQCGEIDLVMPSPKWRILQSVCWYEVDARSHNQEIGVEWEDHVVFISILKRYRDKFLENIDAWEDEGSTERDIYGRMWDLMMVDVQRIFSAYYHSFEAQLEVAYDVWTIPIIPGW
jgi:hypothetical protein